MERITKSGYKFELTIIIQGLTRYTEIDEIMTRLAEFEDAEEARNKGCDFSLDPDGDSCDNNIYIDHTHGAAITTHDVYVPINFCPMCGKPLKEKHETDII